MANPIRIAIDGNEANVKNRVGSNGYAFKIIEHVAQLVKKKQNLQATVLLSHSPLPDLPKETKTWQYRVIKPAKFWTQLAAPIYLFLKQRKFDVFFTPGHYAPRLCPIPYISSVMDLAFLDYKQQFKQNDWLQLKNWTKYSVQKAAKIVAISNFTKHEIVRHYQIDPNKIVVAYPNVFLEEKNAPAVRVRAFFKKHNIQQPYFLFVGTLQPRKNLLNLITAYELFCQNMQENEIQPQLVIAGKVGWLAQPILDKIKSSPVQDQIVLTDFVPNQLKNTLYQQALATILIGFSEGFGMPPLESMHFKTLPIVSDGSSLPEVVGDAGLKVNPYKPELVAETMRVVWQMKPKEKQRYIKRMNKQIHKFSWQASANKILDELVKIALEEKGG